MAHGTKTLSNEAVLRLVKLWEDDARFGTRHRFAERLAEILNGTQTPSDGQTKSADKRLERIVKQKAGLTSPTANAIAQAAGVDVEMLKNQLFGRPSKPDVDQQDTYRHLEIIHYYDLMDPRGQATKIRTAEKVEVLRREIVIGGSYWESEPLKLKAWLKHVKMEQPISADSEQSLWSGAVPVEVQRVVKAGKLYRWDTYFEPALCRGEVVCHLTSFELRDEFNSRICSDSFHSMQEIGSFTWRIEFPRQRPASRWWVTADYLPSLPSNTVLASHHEKTTSIHWSTTGLPKGAVYFINWEW